MARLPYAAKTLIGQVTEHKSRTKAEPDGEPDGLGVYRTIKFNKDTSKWLEPLLGEISDPRIDSVENNGGVLSVTFVAGIAADDRSEFPLEDALTVREG